MIKTIESREYVRWFLVAVGIVVILIGVSNALTYATRSLGDITNTGAVQTAFAPLGTVSLYTLPATIATTTPITPTQLKIPSIGVSAKVEQVGQKEDGSMATPTSFQDVGWYKLGSKPGQQGSAVIAGHVNNALTTAGVFEHLSNVKMGDYITVSDASGRTLVYVVTQTAQYSVDNAPVNDIFSQSGPSQLVLITCDGAWDADAHSYNKRFVVYAKLTAK